VGASNNTYTGVEVTLVVPAGVFSMTVDMAGAQGGQDASAAAGIGGKGGRVQATLTTTPGETLLIGVGGAGNNGAAAGGGAARFYAGAKGGDGDTTGIGTAGAGSGGGQSYIKRGGTADTNRVLVGGAGGGACNGNAGLIGGTSLSTEATTASSATAGANAGTGSTSAGGGGGGGGWVGGTGGVINNGGGGGGTSMAHSTQTSGVTSTSGYQAGDGYINLTWADQGVKGTQFYLGIVDDDQTGGTTIKTIQTSAPTANSATTDTWSSATVTTETLIPLTASTTASDTSSSNGWCFNNGGASGLNSTSGAKRFTRAGVWNFSMGFTLNAPALLATIACTVTAKVYRVATGGGARTLLFSATSANFAASATVTWASASQSEYVLQAGEVFQVAFTATSAATAALVLGAITNTVLTLNLGANSFFTIPSPGIGTLAETAGASTGTGAAVGVEGAIGGMVAVSAGLGTQTGVMGSFGGMVAVSAGLGNGIVVGASRAATAGLSGGLGATNGLIGGIASVTASSTGAGNASAVATAIFAGVGNAAGVGALLGKIGSFFSGVGQSQGSGIAIGLGSSVSGTVGNANGVGAANGKLSRVLGTVGNVNIGAPGSGSTTYPQGLLRLNAEGNIEELAGGSGTIPAGVLATTEYVP
jgi:hypothetical protein